MKMQFERELSDQAVEYDRKYQAKVAAIKQKCQNYFEEFKHKYEQDESNNHYKLQLENLKLCEKNNELECKIE